jgi:hypothetical protein
VNLATAVLHAVTDLALVNIQADVIHRLHGGASLVFSESASAEFSLSTPSAPPPTYTFKLIGSKACDSFRVVRIQVQQLGMSTNQA